MPEYTSNGGDWVETCRIKVKEEKKVPKTVKLKDMIKVEEKKIGRPKGSKNKKANQD